jgi:hypothetical protein
MIENLPEGVRGKYIRSQDDFYIFLPPQGGGRFMRSLPEGTSVVDVLSVNLSESYENPLLLNLKRYADLIAGTPLEGVYAEPIAYVVANIDKDVICPDETARAINHYITSPSSSPDRSAIMEQVTDNFSGFQACGQALADTLTIFNFGNSLMSGAKNLFGDSVSSSQIGEIFGSTLTLFSLLKHESGGTGIDSVHRTARRLIERFSDPSVERLTFLVRNLAVRSLGEYFYTRGETFVKSAKNATTLPGYHSSIYYAYPHLMASFLCFDFASQGLEGSEKSKVVLAARLADELAARVFNAMLNASWIAPETLLLIAEEELVKEARKSKRNLDLSLADIFDINFLYPEFFRAEMMAEALRYKGDIEGGIFSMDFSTFVHSQFHGLPSSTR